MNVLIALITGGSLLLLRPRLAFLARTLFLAEWVALWLCIVVIVPKLLILLWIRISYFILIFFCISFLYPHIALLLFWIKSSRLWTTALLGFTFTLFNLYPSPHSPLPPFLHSSVFGLCSLDDLSEPSESRPIIQIGVVKSIQFLIPVYHLLLLIEINLLYLLLGLLRFGNESIEIVWIIFGKCLMVSEVLSAQRTGGFVGEMLWVLNRLLQPLNSTGFMHVMLFITVQLKDHSKLFAFILFIFIRI